MKTRRAIYGSVNSLLYRHSRLWKLVTDPRVSAIYRQIATRNILGIYLSLEEPSLYIFAQLKHHHFWVYFRNINVITTSNCCSSSGFRWRLFAKYGRHTSLYWWGWYGHWNVFQGPFLEIMNDILFIYDISWPKAMWFRLVYIQEVVLECITYLHYDVVSR